MQRRRTIVVGVLCAVAGLMVGGALGWLLKPQPEPDAGQASGAAYWYVEEIATYSEAASPERDVPTEAVAWEQRSERWVMRTLDGLWSGERGRVVSGDPRAAEAYERFAGGPRSYGPGIDMRPPLEALPTEATALRALLLAAVDDQRWDIGGGRWVEGQPTPERREYGFVETVIALLVDAQVTPDQRRALFASLKLSPGAQPAPETSDALGRTGDTIRITINYPDPGYATYTVMFDATGAAMLFFSLDLANSAWSERHTIVRAGPVAELSHRP